MNEGHTEHGCTRIPRYTLQANHKTVPSLVSVFRSDPFQFSCCFPNLLMSDTCISYKSKGIPHEEDMFTV